jgi:hypothetical protein
MDIVEATRNYEVWMRGRMAVVRSQLVDKHQQMAKDLVSFLRGTFFRWAQVWPEVCPDLKRGPKVLAVGDLHIASFGTWRDGCGRLVWGVDDFDEAYPLPYSSDLVRLAASASLDAKSGELSIRSKTLCDFVLEGYRDGLKAGGCPFVLEEHHKWLRKLALDRLDVPSDFWKGVARFPPSRAPVPKEAEQALRRMIPDDVPFTIKRRIAGVGSLGHPRFVGVAEWCGGQIAIEAKAAIPSACAWADSSGGGHVYYQRVLDCAKRACDPFVKLDGKWLMRRLAPDSSPLDIESLIGIRDEERFLRAMAVEAANVHLGSARSPKRILEDLDKRPAKWLRSAVKDMSDVLIKDWKKWKQAAA